jgi:exosortase E/protease (VPEID-CTERM system)
MSAAPDALAVGARRRSLALAGLLFLETVLLALRFDADAVLDAPRSAWTAFLAHAYLIPQLGIAMVAAALLVGAARPHGVLWRTIAAADGTRQRWPYVVAHLLAFVAFVALTARLFAGDRPPSSLPTLAWIAAGTATLAFLVLAAVPPAALPVLLRRLARPLALATALGALAWYAGQMTVGSWSMLRGATLQLAGAALTALAMDPVVDGEAFLVGTPRFTVMIAPACSGYEGIGLIAVFLVAYLWLFRDTLRWPRAALLLPVGIVLVWLANIVRIVALVLVGTWISPVIARGGFHSYAGSLLFCVVALGLAWSAQHSAIFTSTPPRGPATHSARMAAAYLVPLLAILVAALVAGAASAPDFEALYPLRVVAGAAALWAFRGCYDELRGRPSWTAVAAGGLVFALWIGVAPADARAGTSPGPPPALTALPAGIAALWIVTRVVGAVVTVPLAEELAFRGYLMRRVGEVDFWHASFSRVSAAGIVVSSLLFGALHQRLVAGTLAGLVFAAVALRRGRLSDAVVAHATTNALLAAYVLATGSWALWT